MGTGEIGGDVSNLKEKSAWNWKLVRYIYRYTYVTKLHNYFSYMKIQIRGNTLKLCINEVPDKNILATKN